MRGRYSVNGQAVAAAPRPLILIDSLRRCHGLTGTRAACREGDCGSCQVLVKFPGEAQFRTQLACLLREQDVWGCEVLTIEAIPFPNALQRCLSEAGASQCGYCSPGLVINCLDWLLNGPDLSGDEGLEWLNGSLCRCTGYMGQRRAVARLADTLCPPLRHNGNRVADLVRLGLLPAFADSGGLPQPVPERPSPGDGVGTPLIGGGTDVYLQPGGAGMSGPSLLRPRTGTAVRRTAAGFALSARHDIEHLAACLEALCLLPVFRSFTRSFGSLQIRSRATLGGNLAHASPVGDAITLLMALDATLETSERRLSIHELYCGFKTTCLQPGEVIEWVHLPARVESCLVFFDKVSRRPTGDIAVVNMAGCWQLADGRVGSASLACGGASAIPLRLTEIEMALSGAPIEAALEPSVEEALQTLVDPIDDVRGSAAYRRLLLRQLLRSQWQALRDELAGGERHGGEDG